MRPSRLGLIALLAASELLSSCAAWSPALGLYEGRSGRYEVMLPDGWLMDTEGGALLLTRDGPELQYILVQTSALGESGQGPDAPLHKGMGPLELAEAFMERSPTDGRIEHFTLEGISTGAVLGYHGFKATGSYMNRDGLWHRFVYYGFTTGGMYYGLSYSGARRSYFDRDLPTFNAFLSTFKATP